MTLALRYTVRSDVGLLREGNEDSAYAGPHLLAIADGMGGHAAGEVASAVAISTLAPLDADTTGVDLLQALADAVTDANAALNRITISDPATEGMGTTLTALLWSGDEVALCHIGDSRAYLLREGSFRQITHDHTLVQSLVDEGRLTPEAAASHPQRSLVMRALQSSIPADPDLTMLDARVGDRYLLCSDGLSDVVSDETLGKTLTDLTDLDEAVERLVDLAIRSGGPDNITCVLADVIDPAAGQAPSDKICLAGAVASSESDEPVRSDSPAARAHLLTRGYVRPVGQGDADGNGSAQKATSGGSAGAAQEPASGGSAQKAASGGSAQKAASGGGAEKAASGGGAEKAASGGGDQDENGALRPASAGRRRWPVVTTVLALLVAVVGGGGYYGWRLTQTEYYVGVANGRVAVFRGVNQAVAGVSLYSVVQQTDIPLSAMPTAEARQIMATLPPGTLQQAQRTVSQITRDYRCVLAQTAIRAWMAHQPSTAAGHSGPTKHTTTKHTTTKHTTTKHTTTKHTTTKRASAHPTPSPTTAKRGTSPGPTPSTQAHPAANPPRPALPGYCSASLGGGG